MRVRFTSDHDDVTPERTIAYKASAEETVTKELGEALIDAKKAEAVTNAAAKPAGAGKPGDKADGD